MITVIVIAAVAAFVLFVGAGGSRISGVGAHELVAQGARLVDVRTTTEFSAGHVDGALNIPVQDLSKRLSELGDVAKPIVVYCHSGTRSARAARILESAGFTSVHDLGAMSRW